ncbi:hypothetical protein [Deinococcus pimensis]|uniref:hypothetical protein n=1 Tax=Deinococcus pimensis TaxID=309888 RepID=UPI000480B27B|nr:hypothetical protein [Deinococcus pimensis]
MLHLPSRRWFTALLVPLLFSSPGVAQGIAPQLEPERTVTCAAAPTDTPCRSARLNPTDLALLRRAASGQVLPYRASLWTTTTREYKLVASGGTLYVKVARGGDGPWQVTGVATTPTPRVFVPAGSLSGNAPVTLRVSGFPMGARVTARVTTPDPHVGAVVSGGTVAADGTLSVSFVMPAVWRLPAVRVVTPGGTRVVPAQDRLITETDLVVRVSTPDGRVEARTPPLPYRANVAERDLSAVHDGQLRFRLLAGAEVRETPSRLEVLERGVTEVVTVMSARRFDRRSDGPVEDAAYVARLTALHPDALDLGGQGEVEVEGAVDTPDGRAWRLRVRDGEIGPVYVLPRGAWVWVLVGNPAHGALLDVVVRTVEVPTRP